MERRLWTARELADVLSEDRTDAERTLAMRRVQHWTAKELLMPVEYQHGGRGTVRRYAASTLLEAAIFWEMSERNMSLEKMAYAQVAWEFGRSDDEPHPYEVALKGERRVLLLLDLSPVDPKGPRFEIGPSEPVVPSDWKVGLWIDLTALFARFRPYFS